MEAWLIHVNVLQNPLKCCEVISLQLIKINEKKKKKEEVEGGGPGAARERSRTWKARS